MSNITKGIGIILGALWMTSCSDLSFGNKFLGDQPESSGATTEIMFSTKENAEKVLTKAYTGLMYGISVNGEDRMGGNVLESITDLCQSFRNNIGDGPTSLYYNGQLSPNDVATKAAYLFGGHSDWTTIRYAWLYIENVDKVPNFSNNEKIKRVAEAKTLIALSYFRMMRYIGGVPWLDHSIDINESMNFPRITFAQTVDNIVALLGDAIPYLDWKADEQNDGRMTAAGAMALKFQVLHWAASPTFNSDTKWHPMADDYTCYGNYSLDRWKAAAKAGEDFFAELKLRQEYELIQPEAQTHEAYRKAYRKAYYQRGGSEILLSIRKGYDVAIHQPYLDSQIFSGPTLNYVDMFPWDTGDDFPAETFNWKNPSTQPFFTQGTMIPTRDPRLYENIVCPGDKFKDGTPGPVYTNHPNYKANGSGFLTMKFILQEPSDRIGVPVQWPYLRLPEIMLGYAEVLNEVNGKPTTQAEELVKEVRSRVGLTTFPQNMDKKQFLEFVLKERALELGFEEVRWFDLVRRGRKPDFIKPLYGLRSKAEDNMQNPTTFTFEKVSLDGERYWVGNWDTKWYLAPIPQKELNKKYGMTQNPGW